MYFKKIITLLLFLTTITLMMSGCGGESINDKLDNTAVIDGTIKAFVNSEEVAIGNANLLVYNYQSGEELMTSTTDENGNYEITGVEEGIDLIIVASKIINDGDDTLRTSTAIADFNSNLSKNINTSTSLVAEVLAKKMGENENFTLNQLNSAESLAENKVDNMSVEEKDLTIGGQLLKYNFGQGLRDAKKTLENEIANEFKDSLGDADVDFNIETTSINLIAKIKGSITAEGENVTEVIVDWGDSDNIINITKDFSDINISHKYSSVENYYIEITVITENGSAYKDIFMNIRHNIDSSKPDMIIVPAGRTPENDNLIQPMTLDYDIEISEFEVTHEEYIEFLNEINVNEYGYYNDGDTKPIISIPSNECAIDYDRENENFYFSANEYVPSIDTPVSSVSWYGAILYANWLSEKHGLNPAYDLNNWEIKDRAFNVEGYRLPTLYEWKYTANGGSIGENTTYSGSNDLDEVGWYEDNSGGHTHIVGQKDANELGIYDMTGNVLEWLNDEHYDYEGRFFQIGGSWYNSAFRCKIDVTSYEIPSASDHHTGFRIAKTR